MIRSGTDMIASPFSSGTEEAATDDSDGTSELNRKFKFQRAKDSPQDARLIGDCEQRSICQHAASVTSIDPPTAFTHSDKFPVQVLRRPRPFLAAAAATAATCRQVLAYITAAYD